MCSGWLVLVVMCDVGEDLAGVGPWVHRARWLSSTGTGAALAGGSFVVRLFGIHHDLLIGRRGGAGRERGGESRGAWRAP